MHKEAKDFSELWKEKSDYFESLLVYLTVCSFCINRPDIIPNFPPTEKDIALYGKEIERGVSIPGKIAEDFFPWPPQVFKEKLLMLNKVKVSQHEYVYAYLMVLIAECLGLSGVYHWLWAYDKKGHNVEAIKHLEKFGTQLVQKIYELIGYWTAKMEDKKYHSNRVLKSVKAKKAKKGERKQLVIERYWQKSEITKDMSPHRIAKILRKDLEKSMSTDSIKRYLKEEGLVL